MIRCGGSLLLAVIAYASLFASDAPAPNPDLAAADQLYRSGKFADAADKYQAI